MSKKNIAEKLYLNALLNDKRFNFKNYGTSISQGTCPNCHRRTLYFNNESPWKVKCSGVLNCGYSESTESLYPEFLEDHLSLLDNAQDKNQLYKDECIATFIRTDK